MAKGLYDMIDGADDFLNLTAEIKEQLDKELEPYCLLRGGSDVSINDNRKLKLKLSTMSVYSCPTIALTADVANFWRNESDNQLRTTGLHVFELTVQLLHGSHTFNSSTRTTHSTLNGSCWVSGILYIH